MRNAFSLKQKITGFFLPVFTVLLEYEKLIGLSYSTTIQLMLNSSSICKVLANSKPTKYVRDSVMAICCLLLKIAQKCRKNLFVNIKLLLKHLELNIKGFL